MVTCRFTEAVLALHVTPLNILNTAHLKRVDKSAQRLDRRWIYLGPNLIAGWSIPISTSFIHNNKFTAS